MFLVTTKKEKVERQRFDKQEQKDKRQIFWWRCSLFFFSSTQLTCVILELIYIKTTKVQPAKKIDKADRPDTGKANAKEADRANRIDTNRVDVKKANAINTPNSSRIDTPETSKANKEEADRVNALDIGKANVKRANRIDVPDIGRADKAEADGPDADRIEEV